MAVLATLVASALAQSPAWNPQEWAQWNGWKIVEVSATGIPPALERDLREGLRTRGRWKLFKGTERPPFSAKDLLDDLRRIRLFLARRGYPASEVHPEIQADKRANTVRLRFVVAPGARVTVDDLAVSGWPEGVPQPPRDDEHMLQRGQPFSDEAFDRMMEFVLLWLHDQGYAEVEVKAQPVRLNGGRVRVEMEVVPGDFFVIGEVVVSGCAEDLVPVARRVLDLKPGTDFSATRMLEAATDLRATQLFSDVKIDTEVMDPGRLRVKVVLADARMRSWRASVGTWADNPWMVRAGWTHRNLFKRSRGLDVHGTAATHVMSYGVSYYWLGWLSPRARSAFQVERIAEDEANYKSDEYRSEFIQSFRPRGRGLYSIGIGLSNVDVENLSPTIDEDAPEEQGWLLETWFDRKWDWTNDPMYVTRGGYVKVSLTLAPPASIFETPYVKVQLDGAGSVPLSGRFNLAGRGRVGVSEPLGESTDLLANRRFYAGGYNTMRGYERRELGPRDADNNPRGGQAVLLAGAELRIRLFWIFDCALFIDTGQVWRLVEHMSIDEMEAAVGADMDLRSPLGPIRVGYAWNLTEPISGESRGLWHFGIGYPW